MNPALFSLWLSLLTLSALLLPVFAVQGKYIITASSSSFSSTSSANATKTVPLDPNGRPIACPTHTATITPAVAAKPGFICLKERMACPMIRCRFPFELTTTIPCKCPKAVPTVTTEIGGCGRCPTCSTTWVTQTARGC